MHHPRIAHGRKSAKAACNTNSLAREPARRSIDIYQLIAGIDRQRRSGVGGGSETERVTDAELNWWLLDARSG